MRRRAPGRSGPPAPAGRLAPAPPEAPPHPLGTAFLCLFMLPWVLAFRPEPLVYVAVPGLVAWLALMERCRRTREVFLWTGLFGALAIGYGYRWLAPTMQLFGGLHPAAAWALTALFGVAGMLHAWLFALVYRSVLRAGRRPHPLYTVVLLVACETVPIRFFPWMVGHGAVNVPPLVQAAEWGGVPGVSFVLACLVVPLHEGLRWAFARRGPPARPRAALATFTLGVILFGAGVVRHAQVRAEDAAASSHLRVAIVQANVGSLRKRAAEHGGDERLVNARAYWDGSLEAVRRDADLVVWPETAITESVPIDYVSAIDTNLFLRAPRPLDDPHLLYGFLNDLGRDRAFLVGLYERVRPPPGILPGQEEDVRYNAAALRQAGDERAPWSTYRKVHLIPFGEYMPVDPFGNLRDLLPHEFTMKAATLPQRLLEYRGLTFAPFLCYEGIVAEHVREYAAGRRPDVLVSLTNDSWFGDSWEPWQHLNFTRFRAVEHRAPLVRATNTGVSAFVDATGGVVDRLGLDVADVLSYDVPLVKRAATPYARVGHHLPTACWILALLGWLLARSRPPPLTVR